MLRSARFKLRSNRIRYELPLNSLRTECTSGTKRRNLSLTQDSGEVNVAIPPSGFPPTYETLPPRRTPVHRFGCLRGHRCHDRSEGHTSELQSRFGISYA